MKTDNTFVKIKQNLAAVLADPDRKSLIRMLWEFVLCSAATRTVATHYFSSFLYRRTVRDVLDYLSEREAVEIQDKANDPQLADFVTNKLCFIEHFSRGGFPVPRLLGYNTSEKLYWMVGDTWQVADISSPHPFGECLGRLMSSAGVDQVFMKPMRGHTGIGAYRIDRAQVQSSRDSLDRVHAVVSKNSYIFTEVVQQHPEMSRLNPGALNTMRIQTFREHGKEAEILSPFLRVGAKGLCVDNAGAGGVVVGIHSDTGKLKEVAITSFHGGNNVQSFKASPITGVVFDGFQIPLFDEVKTLIKRAAEWIPPALAGWDVGVSREGPVLIEINVLYYGVRFCELTSGSGYRRNPVWQRAVAYANRQRP